MRFIPLAGLALLLFAAIEVYVVRDRILNAEIPRARLEELNDRLAQFPRELNDGEYAYVKSELNPEVVRRSGADAHVNRTYRDETGSTYRVYIGGAIRNKESFHAPNYCMPAAGWEVQDQRSVDSPMGDADSRIRRLVTQKGDSRMMVYYWFQCGRRQTDNDLVARWYRFLDFVASSVGLVDGDAIPPTMIATIYVPFAGTPEEADRRARKFMTNVRPALLDAVDPGAK